MGPGPALAAAARLRRWAHDQATAGADLGGLAEKVLTSGRSIALAAIAVGVLALNARRVTGELDAVLGQPDLWVLPPSDDIQLDHAILLIVLRASAERQNAYRDIADRLTAEYQQHRATDSDAAFDSAVAMAALRLDSKNYRLLDRPDGRGQTWVNDAVVRLYKSRREDGVFDAFVERFALLNDAERVLDSRDVPDADRLFVRWIALDRFHQRFQDGRPEELDMIKPLVAAAIARAAAIGEDPAEPEQVQWAASELLAAAATTPYAVTAGEDVENQEIDSRSADRSAAMSLPYFLAVPALLHQTGVTEQTVRAAVLQLAGSAYAEVRSLLCETFARLWASRPCTGEDDALHTAGLEALYEMVASAGLSAEEGIEVARRPFRFPEPVDRELARGTACVDLRLVEHAAVVARRAAATLCGHSEAARRLADALTTHDQLTWARQPAAMASRSAVWRQTHDTATTELALGGETTRLDAYLAAFDTDPRALAGLLRTLAAQATSRARLEQLLVLWPALLDRYGSRGSLELRQALLPQPTSTVPWTPAQARGLLQEWSALCPAQPHLADRLLDVLNVHGLLGSQEVSLVLDVLGERADAVAVSSRRAVPFLTRALSDPSLPPTADGQRARHLLDALAAQGHQEALRAQHQLEESTGLN